MDKIKRLINFILPVTACNFKCHYCYIGQENRFEGELGRLEYSIDHIAKALSAERLGGTCHINMCGLGETLLAPYALELTERMLRNGHYVSIVTNGTIAKQIQEFCCLENVLKQRLFFKFSFHFLELKRLGLLNTFFNNVRLLRDSGCAFSVELTVNDESIEFIPEIKAICQRELGATCHVIESRNNLDGFSRLTKLPVEEHQKAWEGFDSALFDFQQTQWMVKRAEFCYAGDWIVSLNVGSGWLMPCFAGGNAIQNIFADPDEPIRFAAIGTNCQWTHCYAAYVLLTSGAIPTMQTPCYAQFRDRCCAEKASWLTPDVKAFFESKLYQSNSEYSEDKRIYIDALMALEYANFSRQGNLENLSMILERHFQESNIRTVAIWGINKYEQWLFDLLLNTSIKIKYVVDNEYENNAPVRRKDKLKRQIKYILKRMLQTKEKPLMLNRYDRLPRVDAVIISNYPHFDAIKGQVKGTPSSHLVSLIDLVN